MALAWAILLSALPVGRGSVGHIAAAQAAVPTEGRRYLPRVSGQMGYEYEAAMSILHAPDL